MTVKHVSPKEAFYTALQASKLKLVPTNIHYRYSTPPFLIK